MKWLLGLLGGFSAAGPMTAVMLALHRRLAPADRYPLPPREIAARLAKTSHSETETLLTLGSHFAYGSAMGGLYAAAVPHPDRGWFWKGSLAGLLVWAVNYLGLLPALKILRPASRHPPARNAVMVISHLVWGLALAGFLASVRRDAISRGLVEPSVRVHRDRA